VPDAARFVLAVALSIAAAGCGATSRNEAAGTQSATSVAQELPCGKLPAEASCPGPPPAKPVPMSPDGPVRVFKTEYWGPGETNTENGVYDVAATAPGTFAETGTVEDARPGHEAPIEDATVTISSVSGPGLASPPGGEVRVTTKTGYGGGFAFIDIPAAHGGSCYRMVIVAAGIGRYESVDVIEPDVYDDGGIELFGGTQKDPYPYPTRGKKMPPVDRACAAQALR
jgi:hypothetical protein